MRSIETAHPAPTSDADLDARPTCYDCLRPLAHCICDACPRVDNRTEVVVLQHPRERRHPFGTARFASLGLARARVVVPQRGFDRSLHWTPLLAEGAALLFPSPGAKELARLPADRRPRQLVVLDGTWTSVRRLLRDNPWLRELPHVRLSPEAPSRYRIRREPRVECLSTIESIVQALLLIEPETPGMARLLGAFDAMIEGQLAHPMRGRGGVRRKRARMRPSRAVPDALLERPASHVIVYGETHELASRADPRAAELLQWVALRPETGETFECFVRASGAPASPEHLARMDLSPRALAAAVAPSTLAERWAAFVRPDDLLLAWNPGALTLAPGAPRSGLLLKGPYCNLRRRPPGTLDDVVAREGLAPPPLAVSGRAGVRLANATAVRAMLRREAARLARTDSAVGRPDV